MPTPRANESRSDFVSRCIPVVLGDGTASSNDQAVAVCNSMWEDKAMTDEADIGRMADTTVLDSKQQPNSEGKGVIASMIPFDAISFAQVDEFIASQDAIERMNELFRQFESLVHNVLYNSEVEAKGATIRRLIDELDDKLNDEVYTKIKADTMLGKIKGIFTKAQTKTEGGVKYKASDYAYVPDSNAPSTWKLRMAEGSSGNITKAQLGRAAAAFSPGGFRGQKVKIPSTDVAKVKRKLRGAYRKLGVDTADIPESIKAFEGLTIWKEGDLYRWFAVHSNKYRDVDNPPEILSEAAHERFVKQVDAGLLPYPELQHWHTPSTQWGAADWLAYDKDTGMMLSSGYVLQGHEHEAKAVMAMEEPLAVSHGLSVIERSKDDPTIIDYYITHEISDLPLVAAANKLTGFHILDKEAQPMSIPDEKREHLLSVGLSADQVDAIDADLDAKAATAEAASLEFKDEDTTQPEAGLAGITAEELANAPVEDLTEEDEVKPEAEAAPKNTSAGFATKEEVAVAMAEYLQPMQDQLNAMATTLEAMSETDEEKVAKVAADTPAFSIGAIVAQQLRASEADATRLGTSDMKLAKDKPVETETKHAGLGIPFLDEMLTQEEQ